MPQTNHFVDSYVIALYDLAKKQEIIDLVYQQVKQLKLIMEQTPDFIDFVTCLSIDKQVRKTFVNELFKKIKFNDLLSIWLYVLIDNKKINQLSLICDLFENYYQEVMGKMKVVCYSANELSKSEINKIINFVANKTSKQVEIENKIDASLIAGIKLEIGSKTYDNTLKGKLDGLKKQLLSSKQKE